MQREEVLIRSALQRPMPPHIGQRLRRIETDEGRASEMLVREDAMNDDPDLQDAISLILVWVVSS